MDLFATLPAEIRLEILLSIRSQQRMWQLMRASPAISRQYNESREYLSRMLLVSDFDDCMIQDAMAIILSVDTPGQSWRLSRSHFDLWASQKLPNPIEERDRKTVLELGKLHGRLMLFIEDYLTKSTAVFPPRELLCLPNPFTGQLTFKDRIVTNRFDAADLTDQERKRLLRAFLRHEVHCKLRRPPRPISQERNPLYIYGDREFVAWEREAIQCVQAYLESLYGAMFAHCGDSRLPDIPGPPPSSPYSGLIYPDYLYMNADEYARDLDPGAFRRSIASTLACCGLDLAAAFLRSATTGRQAQNRLKESFLDFFERAESRYPHHLCYTDDPLLGRDLMGKEDRHYQEGPGLYRALYPRVDYFNLLPKCIYRQRAWVFLDDDRFTPSSINSLPHYPTPREVRRECEAGVQAQGLIWCRGSMRSLHRSERWLITAEKAACGEPDKGSQGSEAEAAGQIPPPRWTESEAQSGREQGNFGRLPRFWR